MPRRYSHEPIRAIRAATTEIKGCEELVAQAQAGSKAARDAVILKFLPWIQKQARLYAKRCGRHDLVQDMQQEAICGSGNTRAGLMRAIELFDPSHGRAFEAYAIYWVNKALLGCVASNSEEGWSQSQLGRKLQIRTVAGDLQSYLGREPTLVEIRNSLHWDEQKPDFPSDEYIQNALAETDKHKPLDTSDAANAVARSFMVDEGTAPENAAEIRMLLRHAKALTAKQERAMQLFYSDGYTLKEVAEQMGVSSTSVLQHLRLATKKLQAVTQEKSLGAV